ncbi:hypothetical protein [Bacillus velezensis]|uniref:hypothetical protein n=1 Tax=Bacillus velezensis TaxID=492670 RepID=UPI0038627E6B
MQQPIPIEQPLSIGKQKKQRPAVFITQHCLLDRIITAIQMHSGKLHNSNPVEKVQPFRGEAGAYRVIVNLYSDAMNRIMSARPVERKYIIGGFNGAGNIFMLTGLGFWFYPQYEYRPDMKANLALIGALISFTAAAYFKDIDKYIEKREDQ